MPKTFRLQSFRHPTGTTYTPSSRRMAYLVVPVSIMRNDGAFIFVVSILEARSFKFFAPFSMLFSMSAQMVLTDTCRYDYACNVSENTLKMNGTPFLLCKMWQFHYTTCGCFIMPNVDVIRNRSTHNTSATMALCSHPRPAPSKALKDGARNR